MNAVRVRPLLEGPGWGRKAPSRSDPSNKAIKASLVKMLSNDNKMKTTSQLDSELNQLISKAISSNEVVDILDSVGLSKPNVAILSDEFLAEVRGMKQKNLAVELLSAYNW